MIASSHRSRGRARGRVPTGDHAASLRGHSHFESRKCSANLACCLDSSSSHGNSLCDCSALSIFCFIRDIVACQSSSACRTQPTIFLSISRWVAANRPRFREPNGRATRPKRAVGCTVASNNRRRKWIGICRFTNQRRKLLNFAQARPSR